MSNKANQESTCTNGTPNTFQSLQGTENRVGTQMHADTSVEQKAHDLCTLGASSPSCTPPAEQQAAPKAAPGVGNSGFDHKTAADFLNGKTISDEAVRKFVATSRWAHDEKAALSAMLLSVRGVLASREAEIALLKKALLEAVAAPQQEPAFWMNDKGHTWNHSDWKQFPKHRAKYPIPLYPHFPAPQPAPAPLIARSLAEWHEDDGCVAWWAWNGREWAGEPAWIGNPNCEDWPGYHTHWTPHPDQPVFSALAAQERQP